MKRLLVLSAVVLSVAVLAPVSAADAPLTSAIELQDVTFPDAYLSDACGASVDVTLNGTLTVALFADQNGTFVREIDTFRGTIRYSAGSNAVTTEGSSVSRATYPEGASLGDPAFVTVTGPGGGTIAGGPPGAGQVAFEAEIVFVDSDGVPITAPVSEFELHGTFAAATAAMCDALT